MLQQDDILCPQTQNKRNTIEKKIRKILNKFKENKILMRLYISTKIFSIFQPSFLISRLELRTVGIATLQT